jgi:hypothetical protein
MDAAARESEHRPNGALRQRQEEGKTAGHR